MWSLYKLCFVSFILNEHDDGDDSHCSAIQDNNLKPISSC